MCGCVAGAVCEELETAESARVWIRSRLDPLASGLGKKSLYLLTLAKTSRWLVTHLVQPAFSGRVQPEQMHPTLS